MVDIAHTFSLPSGLCIRLGNTINLLTIGVTSREDVLEHWDGKFVLDL
jgi:hypothetical protein